ncbi:Putative glucose-6-phosphate 1-epimerase [Dendrobium catenatum]|uniref:Glucose-6-phosphate 1-epimerase n=1 Tax=Dendrobium catenatum TaxID=906689 RepID=A0A2I0WQL8_9ASPA|nr:Putative glucose-6-phosphate 1-epimerase [Dendrobium catenatum]
MAACISVAFPVVPIPSSSNPSLHRRRRFAGNVTAAMSQTKDASFGVKVVEGIGGLPKVCLSTAYGSEAEIYLFGACLTSWKLENGKDLLFIRPDAVFNGKKPIRAVEESHIVSHSLDLVLCSSTSHRDIKFILLHVCAFEFHVIPHDSFLWQHGFARNMEWSLKDSQNNEGEPVVTLELKDDPYTRSMWDFSFQALYKASISGVTVEGLKGCKALNKDPDPANPIEGKEERDVVTFPGFVDCIYLGASNELQLENGLGDTLTIRNTNWPDTVLWNPHTQMESCYRDFVCVENAQVGRVQLKPDQAWVAEQNISFT